MTQNKKIRNIGVRKDEVSFILTRFVWRIVWTVAIWLVFRDIIGAPNWGAWAVSVIVWFTLANSEWLTILARRSQ